jgi:hypothetical protein
MLGGTGGMRPDMTRSGSYYRIAALAATLALIGSLFGLTSAAHADGLPLTDVAAAISAPTSAAGLFAATGKITNTGALGQPAGSTVSFTLTGGSVSAVPAGCVISGSGAVCTAGSLNPGASQSFTLTEAPAAGSTNVQTVVRSQAAFVEISVPPPNPNDDTATANTSVLYKLDVTLTNNPSNVLLGNDTLLSAKVTNNGVPQSGVTLTITTGGTADPALALPAGCASANGGANVVCSNVALSTGQTKQFDVAVTSPTSGSSMTSTATATGANGSTGSASVSTTLSANAQAFVPQGHSLSYSSSAVNDTFSVPQGAAPGIFLTLRQADITGTMCGTSPCNSIAAEAVFPSNGTYQATDPNHPLIFRVAYTFKQTCNGIGTPSGCNAVYWIGSGSTTAQQVQPCPTYSQTREQAARMADPNTPCLNFVNKTTQGLVTYSIALLKDISIPIISGVAK